VIFRPLHRGVVGDYADYLWLLLGGVGFVLLVVCTNLAGINLARGRTRTQEMAVRAALGASRKRLIRQLLIEHVALALVAGLAGFALAWWCVRLVLLEAGNLLPRAESITVDLRVLAFALAISLATGVLTGLFPALQVSRTSVRDQMVGLQRGSITGGRNLPGAVLVGVEVALALLLLTGGGLLIRSYRMLLSHELGFDANNLITAEIALSSRDAGERVQYWEGLLARLRGMSGVEAAGASNWIPLGVAGSTFLDLEGGVQGAGAGYRAVSDDYLRALGLPLLAGRGFARTDDIGSPRVVIINQRLAETYFRHTNPIGQRIRARGMESTQAPWLTIIGVTADLRHWGPAADPRPEMYVNYRQVPFHAQAMTAVVRTRVPPATLVPAVREQIRQHDPNTPADLGLLQERLERSLQARRLIMTVLSTFAALALLLAALGLYSLLSFAVSQRTREIAVRAALGARRVNLVRMVFGNAMIVVSLGILAGLLAAIALTRFLAALLVDVQPLDPITLIAGTLCLLLAGTLAALWPATRAARLDPLTALRTD
jgi:putative ABC transport system permease protein